MNVNDAIQKDTFYISQTKFSLFLFNHQLGWCPKRKDGEEMSEWKNVKFKDILHLDLNSESKKKKRCCLNPLGDSKRPISHLVIHYAQKEASTQEMEIKKIRLRHQDINIAKNWFDKIQRSLEGYSNHRPKNILVFVNPYGGKKRGVSIFEKKVKPVLDLCEISYAVINTTRPNDSTDTIIGMETEKLLAFDVICGVGGDGTMTELVSGLLLKFSKSAEDPNELLPTSIPIAVISAGSSNALACSVHGTEDPLTGAIYLALGNKVPLDIGAIHNQNGISRFILGQMSYGHLAETLVLSEKLRWMGPKRYDYAGAKKFLGHATYEGTIEMRVAKETEEPTTCGGGEACEVCSLAEQKISCEFEWKRIEGEFIGLSSCLISCKCALTPLGLSPYSHLSDGKLELIVIRKTSRLNHLRYLIRTNQDSRQVFNLPFVERYRVNEFIFTPSRCCNNNTVEESESVEGDVLPCDCGSISKKRTSLWNSDGEIYKIPSVRVTVHSGLVQIMARGRENSDI